MKSISSLILSISFHILLIVALVTSYLNIQKTLESNKTSNKKLLCISLASYKQSPTQEAKKNKLKTSNEKREIKKETKEKAKNNVQIIQKKIKGIKKKNQRKKQKHVLPAKKEIRKSITKKKNKVKIYNEPKTKITQKTSIINADKKAQQIKKCSVTTTKPKQKIYTDKYRSQNINTIKTIRKLIVKNLYYPRKARRRHIEGIVKIRFKLTQSGRITKIQILSNSPKILSKAAITTLEKIEKLLPHPNEDIIITLPIVYKLLKER